MPIARHEGQEVEYAAFPHEHGGGFSYNIRLDPENPQDVIHLDTKSGTVFTDEDIVGMFAFWNAMRDTRATAEGE